MIDLRGLHLGNIARSPAESVRPDLWPDHAWVPALGCTGGVLYDLCGGKAGENSARVWSAQGMVMDTDMLTTYNRASLLTGWGARFGASPFTILVDYTPLRATGSAEVCVLGAWKISGDSDNQFMLAANYRFTAKDFYPHFSVRIGATEYTAFHTPKWTVGQRMVVGGVRNGTTISLARDGVVVASASCAAGAINTSSLPLVFGGIAFSAEHNTHAIYHASSIHLRALAAREIAELSADPLLPFRRRQPVYYSVPSGGGSTRNLIAALTGESTTGTISAIIARALAGDVSATSITGAITASMARDLLASLQGQSTTGDIAATLQRLLLASLGAASATGDVATTTARALLADLQAESTTPDIAATLAALVALTASISGTTTAPAVAAAMARALAANVAGQSTTGAITIQFAGLLLLVASITGASTTGALTATTSRELRAAIDAASASGQVDGQLLRQIAATVVGASVTGTIAAELVNLVSLAASVVGASITSDVVAAMQRGLAADVAAGSTTGAAAVTVARTLAAAVEAGSLTPDNLVLILTGLGILHDTTIISRTPRRGITSRTVRRTIHSA